MLDVKLRISTMTEQFIIQTSIYKLSTEILPFNSSQSKMKKYITNVKMLLIYYKISIYKKEKYISIGLYDNHHFDHYLCALK